MNVNVSSNITNLDFDNLFIEYSYDIMNNRV